MNKKCVIIPFKYHHILKNTHILKYQNRQYKIETGNVVLYIDLFKLQQRTPTNLKRLSFLSYFFLASLLFQVLLSLLILTSSQSSLWKQESNNESH